MRHKLYLLNSTFVIIGNYDRMQIVQWTIDEITGHTEVSNVRLLTQSLWLPHVYKLSSHERER